MANSGCTNPSVTDTDRESSLHDVKTKCIEHASSSCEICPSTGTCKCQSENGSVTIGNHVDFAAALPEKYLCGTCGVLHTDLLELKEHIKAGCVKDHKSQEENRTAVVNQDKKPALVKNRPVRSSRRKKRKVEEMSEEIKWNMEQLLREGVSRQDVSQLLNIPIERVRNVKSSKISEELENFILTFIRADRFFRIPHLCKVVKQELNVSIHDSAIRSLVLNNGYASTWLQHRRQLTDDSIAEQLAWANYHIKWTEKDWDRVLWTGEAGFRTYAHPDPDTPCSKSVVGRRLMWHLEDEDPTDRAIRSSKTGKEGVRVWACICTNGVGRFCRIKGTLDPVKYLRILQDCMLPSAWALIGPDFILQHDSDLAADAVSVQRWLSDPVPAEHIDVMVLPTNSNDVFNPLENFFNNLCLSLDGFESDDPDEFWMKIEEVLQTTPVSLCKRLIGMMRERCASVVVTKGRQNRPASVWN